MSRKLERVNIITSILKVHLKYQKYPKKLKTPFFLGSWRRWDQKDDYLVQAPAADDHIEACLLVL